MVIETRKSALIWLWDTLVNVSEEEQMIYMKAVIWKYCKMANVAHTPHLRVKNIELLI